MAGDDPLRIAAPAFTLGLEITQRDLDLVASQRAVEDIGEAVEIGAAKRHDPRHRLAPGIAIAARRVLGEDFVTEALFRVIFGNRQTRKLFKQRPVIDEHIIIAGIGIGRRDGIGPRLDRRIAHKGAPPTRLIAARRARLRNVGIGDAAAE